jgi:hypothetical protein
MLKAETVTFLSVLAGAGGWPALERQTMVGVGNEPEIRADAAGLVLRCHAAGEALLGHFSWVEAKSLFKLALQVCLSRINRMVFCMSP